MSAIDEANRSLVPLLRLLVASLEEEGNEVVAEFFANVLRSVERAEQEDEKTRGDQASLRHGSSPDGVGRTRS